MRQLFNPVRSRNHGYVTAIEVTAEEARVIAESISADDAAGMWSWIADELDRLNRRQIALDSGRGQL